VSSSPLPSGDGPPIVAGRGFRDAIARFATGVTLVTGYSDEGAPVGCTANAVASVSLAPPLLLVCLKRESESLAVFQRTGRFGVSILPEGCGEIARRFAGDGRGARFHGIGLRREPAETPILEEAVSWMDCRVWNAIPVNDHTILIGEVVAFGVAPERSPLLYFASRFGTFDPGTPPA